MDLIAQIIQNSRTPTIDQGRNIRGGHLRGAGLEYGGLVDLLRADPMFQEAIRLSHPLASLVPENKLQNLLLIIRYYLDGSEGDLIEFGSYKGGSAVFMGSVLKQLGRRTRLYALDSYSGMPETDAVRDLHHKGEFVDTSFDRLRNYINENSLGDVVIPVKGLFEETFPRVSADIQSIALAHIDCDIYSAVKYSIRAIKPRLHRGGGYIVFDDPLHGTCLGAMQAIEEDLYHEERLSAEQTSPHLVFRYPPL